MFVSADERGGNQSTSEQLVNARPVRMRTSASATYLAGVEEEESALVTAAPGAGKRMNSTRNHILVYS